MSKFDWKMSKDKWLLLLFTGILLLVIALPTGEGKKKEASKSQIPQPDSVVTSAKTSETYEEQLEKRVKQILKNVAGVGNVDVMIVLKSSEEKILRVDKETSNSSTEEQDSTGGTRKVTSEELKESTILTGSGSENAPIVEKEMKPEIAGIVISASGGDSPTIKAEISSAMEALFDVPSHKIKVLKRVE